MKVSDSFPGRWVGANDLAKITGPATFVIKELKTEEAVHPVTREKSNILVVYFQGATKGHRLRKSEHKSLVKKFGDEVSGWVGQTITLKAVSTQVGDGVRMIPSKAEGK